MKRVSKHQALNLFRYLVALDTKGCQLLRQARQDDAGSLRPQDHGSLLRQHLEDLRGPDLPHAGSEFDESIRQLFLSESPAAAQDATRTCHFGQYRSQQRHFAPWRLLRPLPKMTSDEGKSVRESL